MKEGLTIGAVILAAGAARRMGRLKQVLPYSSTTLLGHIVQQVQAAFDPVVVVIGAQADTVRRVLPDTVYPVHNPRWSQGLGTSLSCGITYLQTLESKVDAAMLVLADQPRVNTGLLQRLVATYRRCPCDAVALQYPSGPGVPALISATLLDALQHASGEGGAKAVLRNPDYRVVTIVRAEAIQDVDTFEDYQEIIAKANQNEHLSPNLYYEHD